MPIFVFTDIERSTHLWEVHGRGMAAALSLHDEILRSCVQEYGGKVIKHTGDGIFAVFEDGDPLGCALAIQTRMRAADWQGIGRLPVRIAIHRGEAERRGDDYFGSAVNRTARLLTAAWGGQTLLSEDVMHTLAAPAGSEFTDHGVHMLKDLEHPQRIFGLVTAANADEPYPPLRSLSTRSHNLPPQPSPFVGRKRELAEIAERLDQPTCRLLTLVGSGGIGKTRLALQVGAEKIDAFSHGVYQVPLAPLSTPKHIFSTIADAMRFPFSGGDEPRSQLRDYLREKELLLILDNFEHLMSGAGIVSDLLGAAPHLKVIVTSRERLNLREEWTYELRGLPMPDPARTENIEQFGAVQLFLQNAYRVFPEFVLTEAEKPHVAQICRLVEGIPLGIELASAWVRALTCADIAAEIGKGRDFLVTTASNVPERHQSLRAVFENSWNLLTEPERRTLQQLAIFRGGFERDAAREVAGASLPLLLSLADKSLIRRGASGRYEMLETIRQYALEKLMADASLHKAVIQRHYLYYASLLERLSSELTGTGQKGALARSDLEVENIREAWRQAIALSDARALRQALDGFFHLYEMRSWFQEGIEQFGRAATVFARSEPTREEKLLHGMLLSRRGWFAFRLGLYEETRRNLLHGLAIFRSLGAHGETAFALYNLGIFTYQLGDYDEAQRYLHESLRLRRELDDRFGVARSLSILGVVARDRGDVQEAREFLRESLALHREIGDQRGVSRCLNLLALIHRDRGHEEVEARLLLEESLEISREIDDRRGVAFALSILSAIIYEMGDYVEARALAEESLEIREEVGERRGIAFSLHDLGNIARALDRHEDAWHYLQRALRTAYEIQAVPLVLYVLTGIAELYHARGQTEEANRLSGLVCEHPSSFEMAVRRAQALQQKLQLQSEADEQKAREVRVDVDDLDKIVQRLLEASAFETTL
jgi:predicted ATPase/class 3 adenylate cyclase/uncharacterized protein HemY